MVLLHFTTTLRDPSTQAAHGRMVEQMRELADATDGFLGWFPGPAAGAVDSGVLAFESEESLAAWRDHPLHGEIHGRGEESVYASFDVRVFEQVRENRWAY